MKPLRVYKWCDGEWYDTDEADAAFREYETMIRELEAERDAARAEVERLRADAARLDYIERTFSGMTNRERYLPVTMGWGKPCMGRTLREACDKYMARDAAIDTARSKP